jgi:hypothetical protein
LAIGHGAIFPHGPDATSVIRVSAEIDIEVTRVAFLAVKCKTFEPV